MKYIQIFPIIFAFVASIPASTPALIGQPCAGFAGIECASGLKCHVIAPDYTVDVQGVCIDGSLSIVGESCGGLLGNKCASGLECVVSRSEIADTAGICVVPSKEPMTANLGEPCGGFVGVICAAGLKCEYINGADYGYCRHDS